VEFHCSFPEHTVEFHGLFLGSTKGKEKESMALGKMFGSIFLHTSGREEE
jgi:hypothetical protein